MGFIEIFVAKNIWSFCLKIFMILLHHRICWLIVFLNAWDQTRFTLQVTESEDVSVNIGLKKDQL